MSDASARPGDVPIVLLDAAGNPETLVLRPTYNAARMLSTQYGGLLKTMQMVGDLNIEVVVQVLSLGLGATSPTRRGAADLAERVWRTGLTDDATPQPGKNAGGLGERCVHYLQVLMNGGRAPADAPEAGDAPADPTQG